MGVDCLLQDSVFDPETLMCLLDRAVGYYYVDELAETLPAMRDMWEQASREGEEWVTQVLQLQQVRAKLTGKTLHSSGIPELVLCAAPPI